MISQTVDFSDVLQWEQDQLYFYLANINPSSISSKLVF